MRPALDLLSRVGPLPPGDVVDLGCGAGAVAGPLRERFPDRRLLGVDLSAPMLAEAARTGLYDGLAAADLALWRPEEPPALVFSNAALNWVPDHAALMPRLAGLLAPGGVLAIGVPGQHDAPSHRLIHEVAGLPPPEVHVLGPAAYEAILRPSGEVEAWETTFLHRLPPFAEGHPVRRFTEATAARPVIAGRSDPAGFLAAYDAALARAYPPEPDGSAILPFRRVFAVLTARADLRPARASVQSGKAATGAPPCPPSCPPASAPASSGSATSPTARRTCAPGRSARSPSRSRASRGRPMAG